MQFYKFKDFQEYCNENAIETYKDKYGANELQSIDGWFGGIYIYWSESDSCYHALCNSYPKKMKQLYVMRCNYEKLNSIKDNNNLSVINNDVVKIINLNDFISNEGRIRFNEIDCSTITLLPKIDEKKGYSVFGMPMQSDCFTINKTLDIKVYFEKQKAKGVLNAIKSKDSTIYKVLITCKNDSKFSITTYPKLRYTINDLVFKPYVDSDKSFLIRVRNKEILDRFNLHIPNVNTKIERYIISDTM